MGTHIAETVNLGLEYADLTWELLPLHLRIEMRSTEQAIVQEMLPLMRNDSDPVTKRSLK